MFRNFCKTLGADHMLKNPNYSKFKTRAIHREAINREINEITRKIPMAELVEKLNKAGIPCGPINRIDQTFSDPQVAHLKISKPVDHPELGQMNLVRMPITMPDIPSALEIRRPAPELGEHSKEVLAELGYDEEQIKRFKEKGVI